MGIARPSPHRLTAAGPHSYRSTRSFIVVLYICVFFLHSHAADDCKIACTEITGLSSPEDQAYALGIRTSGGTCLNVSATCETEVNGKLVANDDVSVESGKLSLNTMTAKTGGKTGQYTFEIDDVGDLFVNAQRFASEPHFARYALANTNFASGVSHEFPFPVLYQKFGLIGTPHAAYGFFFLPVKGLYSIQVTLCCGDVSANSNSHSARLIHVINGGEFETTLAAGLNHGAWGLSGSQMIYSDPGCSFHITHEWSAANAGLFTSGTGSRSLITARLIEDLSDPVNVDTLPRSCAGRGTVTALLIDPDGPSGPIQPHYVSCQDSWTLVANLVDTPGDDFPNDNRDTYLRAGYHTMGSGNFKVNNDTSLGYYPYITAQAFTGVMGVDVIEQYLDAGIFTKLKWCWVKRTGVATGASCRSTGGGEITIPSLSTLSAGDLAKMDPELRKMGEKNLILYMYARLIGWNLQTGCGYGGALDSPTPYTGCEAFAAIFMASGPEGAHTGQHGNVEQAWGENNGGTYVTTVDQHGTGNDNYGIWHLYGWSVSFVPTHTNDGEIRNLLADEIYLVDGFRVWFE